MSTLSSFKKLAGQLMLGPRGELGYVSESHTFQLDHELTRMFAGYTVQYLKQYLANPDDHLFRVALIYNSIQPHPWGAETLRLTDDVVSMIYPVSAIGSKELTSFQKKKRENSTYYGTELLLSYMLKDTPDVPIFLPVLYDRGTTLMQYESQSSTTVVLSESPDAGVIEVLNLVGPAMAARKNLDVFIALKQRLMRTLIRHDERRPVEMKIMEGARAPSAITPPGASRALRSGAPEIPDTVKPALTPTGSTTKMSGPSLNPDPTARQWYNPELHDATSEKFLRFLLQPRDYVDTDQIRQQNRFRDMTLTQQKELAANCPLYEAPTNTVLLVRGSADQWNLYLIQGQVELVAADGEKKIVVGGTDNARNAIASLKPRKFTVTALTPVRFLWIHENIISEIQQRHPGSSLGLR